MDCTNPTEITKEDVDNLVSHLLNLEILKFTCFKCCKEFLPNYDTSLCDECFFSQFPKKNVHEFYKSFLE